MKFGLVSHGLPPSASVQSIVIYRLLTGLNPDDYCVITQERPPSPNQTSLNEKLPAKYYYLSRWFNFERGIGFSLIRWWNVLARALKIALVIRREKCQAVVACTSELFDLPASYVASRLTGVPFYAYVMDYYSPSAAGSKAESFTRWLEPIMLKGAAGVIVLNEFLRDELRQRYGVEPTVVHNPCDLSKYENAPYDSHPIREGDDLKIIYTGSIYEAHYSAFRNLIAAIGLVKKWNIKLYVYSNQSATRLADAGLSGPIVFEKPVPVSDIPAIQAQADLLFLPMSFSSPYPELVRTSSPGKMVEYLAAGRPILVHAPADSYLAWYFREYDCGVVVTEDDPRELAAAIERVLTDIDLRRRLVANAKERARADFSIDASRRVFAKLMDVQV